jgi:hypothetical protein
MISNKHLELSMISPNAHDYVLFTRKTDKVYRCLASLCRWHDYHWRWLYWNWRAQTILVWTFWDEGAWVIRLLIGLELLSSSDDLFLSQAKYVSHLVSRTGLTNCKIENTPLEPNIQYTPQDGTLLVDATIYQQLVGSLIYLIVTRLNISYVVHIVRQFMSSPCTTHYVVVLQIIWYIKGTLFIVFTTQLHPHWFLKPTLMLIVSVIPVIIVPHLFLYISWRFSYIFVDFLLI